MGNEHIQVWRDLQISELVCMNDRMLGHDLNWHTLDQDDEWIGKPVGHNWMPIQRQVTIKDIFK